MAILATVVAFVAGVGVGFVAKGFLAPLPPNAYKTRVALPLQDSAGHPVGALPAGSLIISEYGLGKSEDGWVGFVPLLMGDGSDATELLTGPRKTPSLISITDMLFVNRVAIRQPSAPVAKTKEKSTATPGNAVKH